MSLSFQVSFSSIENVVDYKSELLSCKPKADAHDDCSLIAYCPLPDTLYYILYPHGQCQRNYTKYDINCDLLFGFTVLYLFTIEINFDHVKLSMLYNNQFDICW